MARNQERKGKVRSSIEHVSCITHVICPFGVINSLSMTDFNLDISVFLTTVQVCAVKCFLNRIIWACVTPHSKRLVSVQHLRLS